MPFPAFFPLGEDPPPCVRPLLSHMTEPAPGLKPGSTILVTGASGWVGGVLCQQLRERGFAVKAAVRDPAAAKCEFLSTMGCELVRVPDLLSDEVAECAPEATDHSALSNSDCGTAARSTATEGA